VTGSGDRAALDALVAVAARQVAAARVAPPTADPALRAIASAGAAALRVEASSIALHDASTGRLVFRAAAGPHGDGVVGLAIAPHEGIAGYAFSTGQPLAVSDVTTDPRFERGTAERTGYVPRSLLAVPLVDDEGMIGVMEWLDRLDGAPFDLGDVDLATRVAAAATATARAARMDDDVQRLLTRALANLASVDRDSALDREAIEGLVREVAEELAGADPIWALADRIGELRDTDPEDIELALAWLDALLARSRRRGRPARSRHG
jgi:GAF domain-containing protein